jgi:hypothetical protein
LNAEATDDTENTEKCHLRFLAAAWMLAVSQT